MKLSKLYDLYSVNYKITTDTRNIEKNSIFFALKGTNFNGNLFAKEAISKGALYAIVDEQTTIFDDRIILVKDVLKTLQDLATYHRNKLNIPIIAITGSNGKTTTKELVNAVLSEKYKTIATRGNLNNHIGVPLTLLSMTPKTEIGIIEMGANHPNEITFLCNIANPDYGYITNFGKAHLEGFKNLKGVINAKSELYNFFKKTKKTIFVNDDDENQVSKTIDSKRYSFGKDSSDCNIKLVNHQPYIEVIYHKTCIKSNLLGIYNFNNISAAITIGTYFKITTEKIKHAIEYYIPKNNRSQIIVKGTFKIILDAYNANPTSMNAAIDNFNMFKSSNKIAILGDMFELGNESGKEHQHIVDKLETMNFSNIYLIGSSFYKTTFKNNRIKSYNCFVDFKNDFEKIKPTENSTYLIKASRGMALERAVELI